MKTNSYPKEILVYAHWQGISIPMQMGTLFVSETRGQEIFYFEYDEKWLKSEYVYTLDPDMGLYTGPQFLRDDKVNFGMFLDSSPDRWGRTLMNRREAAIARKEDRPIRVLRESDFLLGVFDKHRMGALRFKVNAEGKFLNENMDYSAPPWTSLRNLEYACLQIENENNTVNSDYLSWLNLLIAPGSSIGGARPKASVVDPNGELWIAKFPSISDKRDVGAWEMITNRMARYAGLEVAMGKVQKFNSIHHTFLTKRFDRILRDGRIHFASAMTLLGYTDGAGSTEGVSYLEIAEFIIQNGAQVNKDLEELWSRIVFSICVTNIDDHLRNHGFLLSDKGWVLSPAYDINPVEYGTGLSLNISGEDNSLNLDLAMEMSGFFRVSFKRSQEIILQVKRSVRKWRSIAKEYHLSNSEQDLMSRAFTLVNN